MPIHGYPGGVISATAPTISPTSASGVWTLDDQLQNAANWPSQSNIARSLRFNSADTAYLDRTPTSTGNRRTWTWAGWVKRSAFGASSSLFSANTNSLTTGYVGIYFGGSDNLTIQIRESGTNKINTTTQVFRDPSSWYHIVIAIDTTQATGTNRCKVYVNGSQVTAFSTQNEITQNFETSVNDTVSSDIGTVRNSSSARIAYFNGYLADVYIVDGQALTPSSFGYTDSNGIWQPNSYTGSYGTNGFWLNFDDNSGTTSTTLGKDSSGNGNNWTPNNFSVTAGAGNDSLVDSPTNYGTDTGVGGEVRGNYATMNPLQMGSGASLANGNLDATSTAATGIAYATIGVSSGKWYWEVTNGEMIGISKEGGIVDWRTATGYAYFYFNGQKYTNGSGASYGATFTTSDTIGVALDMDAGTLTFYKNGVSQGVAFSGLSGTYFASMQNPGASTSNSTFNFGQRSFAYTAPAGFKALCSTNLPTPTIQKGGSYFAPVIYTGNGLSRSITGVGFQPSLVWIKARNAPYSHRLSDAVRGVGKELYSDDTSAEVINSPNGYVTSFDSDGFSLGTGLGVNLNAQPYIAWTWRANGAGSSNTSGSITSTVSANQTAGFSVVTYTGTGASATVGHGLGAAPSMIIVKNRTDGTRDWLVYHASIGNTAAIFLNLTNAPTTLSAYWNNTSPTSSVFSLGNSSAGNGSTNNLVAYCFAPVSGYSAFGSYTGNGSTDGPFVYTGFRPAWVMIKRTNDAASWNIVDVKRNTYNVMNSYLSANTSSAEDSTYSLIDSLSNGFKVRQSLDFINQNTGTFIYAAFAENPFKISRAR